ncbi:hypothetical protein CVE26_09925 [Pseudomonas syringae pv. actinidiae]|nr:hypothetical protein [Pseudomonas syringae pv. actinidiae]
MGCEAAPKRATPVVPDVLYAPVLLPVPGRSRASLLPRPAARIQSRIVYNAQHGSAQRYTSVSKSSWSLNRSNRGLMFLPENTISAP